MTLHRRIGSTVSAMAAVCAMALLSGAAPEGTTLRWKFTPGQVRHYVISQRTTSQVVVDGQEIETNQDLTFDMTWRIKEVGADGSATHEQVFDRVRLEMEMPNGEIEYDSEHPDQVKLPEPREQLKAMVGIFESMLHQPIMSTLTARGEVRDVKMPEGFVESIRKAAGPAGSAVEQLLSEEGLKKLSGMSASVFPEKAVEVGETWSSHVETDLGPLGKMKIEEKQKLEGMVESPAGPLVRIALTIELASEPMPNAELEIDITESESEGTMLFDNQAGYLVSTEMDQVMKMTIKVDGKTLDQTVTTHMSLKPVEGGKGPVK